MLNIQIKDLELDMEMVDKSLYSLIDRNSS